MEHFLGLGLALAIGLLIGTERGWHERLAANGTRIAGIRTFGLLGLLGGLWAIAAEALGELLLGFAFMAVAALLIIAHILNERISRSVGITTTVAALVAFTLGALAVLGYQAVAAAGGVVTALLLRYKPLLHGWLRRLEEAELTAALKLLLISVVILPVLPDRGYGPWGALNPYQLWLMVVLIAAISFIGYFAVKLAGTRRGVAYTGLFGGLVSSTAVTLNLAHLAKQLTRPRLLACAIVLASTTMFPRIALEVAVFNIDLLPAVALPLGAMTLSGYVLALWLWQCAPHIEEREPLPLRNPLEMPTALRFALLLAAVMLLAEWLRNDYGEGSLYLLAAISGLADVDAITLSMARMAQGSLADETASHAIVIAAMVNTGVKAVLGTIIAGRLLAQWLLPTMGLIIVCGLLSLIA